MVKRSWLTGLFARLTNSSRSLIRRRRIGNVANGQSAIANQVEFLEQRRMLTAPTVTDGRFVTLSPVTEDVSASTGVAVGTLLTGAVWADTDTVLTSSGIAVTATTGNGTWEFSTDGTTWTGFGTLVADTSLLLAYGTQVRYRPDQHNGETATFDFRAWDQSTGSASTSAVPLYADTTTNGGTTAYSAEMATARITVTSVNDAPTVASGTTYTLPTITENASASSSLLVTTIVNSIGYADNDTSASRGIAITAATGNGSWEYSTNSGSSWTAIGTVTTSSALLLASNATTMVRYVPDPTNGETATLSFVAWDQTSGTATTKVDVSAGGGTAAFSTQTGHVSLTVTSANDAPVLSGANGFTTITEDDTNSIGNLVSSLISGRISDIDTVPAPLQGIAITAVSNVGTGFWQYSVDAGANWNAVGTVSTSQALLLRTTDLLRFVPDTENGGTASITFLAWDQTGGTSFDTRVNVTSSGGTTPYSSASATASLTVTAVNDAPTLVDDGDYTLTTVTEATTNPTGTLISTILSDPGVDRDDVDTSALSGIAVTSLSGNGIWQYSTNGLVWNSFGTVSATSALLLSSTTQVRYLPNLNGAETATFTFVAWDRTTGTASTNSTRRTADPTPGGGTSAYSTEFATVSIAVTPVNDAPTLTGLESTSIAYQEDVSSTLSVQLTNSIVVADVDSANISGATVTIGTGFLSSQDFLAFTNTGTISGSFSSVTGILTLTGVDTLANYQAALRSVTYHNSSSNPTAGTRQISFRITDSDALPLTSTVVTRNLVVTPTNNAPTLNSVTTAISYTEGQGPLAINALLTITDVDSTTFSSATITLTTYVSSEDQLSFTNDGTTMGNIAVQSNTGGVLTLTSAGSTATTAQWQAALRSITYTNPVSPATTSSQTPPARNVAFVLNDGSSVNAVSNTFNTTLNITPVNSPTVAGSSSPTYTENASALAINSTIVVTGGSYTTLALATITLTNVVSGQDVLGFTNNGITMGNIAVQSNTGGVLTLTSAGATATVAQWQAALRAVTYANTSDNPNVTTRSVSFQVTASGTVNFLSNTVSSSIAVTRVNDASVVTNTPLPTTLNYTEAQSTAVFPNLVLSDLDSTNLTGATVAITDNYNDNGSTDTLIFTNTATITGTFSAVTGILTLTGTDTVANYQAALRTVKFHNIDNVVPPPDRTIELSVTDDTGVTSNTVTRTISISTLNDVPELSGIETAAQVYRYNDPYAPVPVMTRLLSLSDGDSEYMDSAVVKIAVNYSEDCEELRARTNGTSISQWWDSTTGELTLYGTDTIANYLRVMRSITFVNLLPQGDETLSTLTRTITFQVFDDALDASNTVSRDLTFVGTNLSPTVLTNATTATVFNEKRPAVAVARSLTVVDADSTYLESAIVSIGTANFRPAEDRLIFTSYARISGVYDATTGVLTLSGVDTVANYQSALRMVKYQNISTNPSTLPRSIKFVVNDGVTTSSVATQTVNIVAVNDRPQLSITGLTTMSYTPTMGAVSIVPAGNITLTDVDSGTMSSASVRISRNYRIGYDFLTFTNTATISGSFNAYTGILTLTGTDTIANYKLALSNVKYRYIGVPTGITKTFTFSVNDGAASSVNAATRDILVS